MERRSVSIAHGVAWVLLSGLAALLGGCATSGEPAANGLPVGNGQPVALTPGQVVPVGDESLSPLLKQVKEPVLLDAYATWCGPCKMMAPEIEQVAKELSGKLVVARLDVDASPQVAKALSIQSIPALFLFQNGRAVAKWEGYAPAGEIRSQLGSKVPDLR